MADLKISQLTGASTPLAGTEVLPIVQSGSTVKVSVANLTAGRAVGMAGGSFTDNITQSTAAKGVNFTANTPAAGMTSQLLNWYEEGTWTFTLFDAVTGGNASATTATGYYTRIGRTVICFVNLVTNINTTGMTAGNRVWFSLPFGTSLGGSGSAQLSQFVFGADAFVTPVVTNASRGFFAITTNNNAVNQIVVSNLTSGASDIQYLTLTYQI